MKLNQIFQVKLLQKLYRINIDEEHLFFSLTLIVGLFSGLLAVGLHHLVTILVEVFGTNQAFTPSAFTYAGLAILISGYITTRIAPWSAGSGIPQVKIALVTHHGFISFKDFIAKIITSILSLSSGFSIGREGPTAAICAGLGSNLGKFFSLSKNKIKALVAIGSAGGIAAAFNTPISGVLFTLEEIVGDINSKRLGPIVIASVIASVTAASLHETGPILGHISYLLIDNRELFFFLVVGILASFLGPLWVSSILVLRKFEKKIFKHHKLTLMMIVFLIVAGVSHINPLMLGSGNNIIKMALDGEFTSLKILTILFVFKSLMTSLCYSTGISGGVFFPTLFAGAMLGAIIGNIANFFFPTIAISQDIYILVGMGAFFASVIRAPFTSIIMIFEFTQNYNIILPLMLANISSYLISGRLSPGSIYEKISEQDGIHLPTREDDDVLDTINVEDAMVKDVKTLEHFHTIRQAISIVNHSEISGYPVIKNGLIYGVISTNELGAAMAKFKGNCTLADICHVDIVSVYPDDSLLKAFHKLKKFKVSRLLVVSRINEHKLVGIITAADIVSKFGYHIQEDKKADVIDQYLKDVEAIEKEEKKEK